MRTIKDSWFIICSDFRGDKLKVFGTLITTIIFMGYLAGMTSLVTNDVLGDQDRTMIADFAPLANAANRLLILPSFYEILE